MNEIVFIVFLVGILSGAGIGYLYALWRIERDYPELILLTRK